MSYVCYNILVFIIIINFFSINNSKIFLSKKISFSVLTHLLTLRCIETDVTLSAKFLTICVCKINILSVSVSVLDKVTRKLIYRIS